jgi:hypothetical protein
MSAGSIYDNNQGADPQIIDEGVLRILEDLAAKVDKEGQKATTQITRSYQHNLSRRIPEMVGGAPGRSIIDVGRGLLGRKDPPQTSPDNGLRKPLRT